VPSTSLGPSPPPSGVGAVETTSESITLPKSVRGARGSSVYDYGVIGDLRTAALVSRFGSIDWACFPTFSDPSVFGRLLDQHRGGFHQIRVEGASEATQRYLPGTNVLRTHFLVPGNGRLVLTDFMPVEARRIGQRVPSIVRILEAEDGAVPVSVEVDPRFDYGRARDAQWHDEGSGRALASTERDRLTCTSPWAWEFDGARALSVGVLLPGEPTVVRVAWGDVPSAEAADRLLSDTIRYWRSWVHRPDAPMYRSAHVWHDWVERSELLLKLLSHGDTGAFVAAPTTSLPEWPGGPRNWDYRYVWVRDAAFAAQALLLLGHLREACAYVRWVVSCLTSAGTRARIRTVYDVAGVPPSNETVLDHWAGYDGSRPVRIGNAAADQHQLDIYGEVLDAVGQLVPFEPTFIREHWPLLVRLAERAGRDWTRPDSGIWEARTRPAHYVHSKVMSWVAVDRAAKIATAFGENRTAARWQEQAELMHETILRRGYDDGLGAFIQAFDRPTIDASALRIPMTGFLPFDDPRVQSTVAVIEKRLAKGPFVYRYNNVGSQHGPEGSFLLCSFWLVECLARGGQPDRAVRNFRQLLKAAGPLRLFAEEFDPARRVPLGNYPQAFTHIGVLRAALAIGARRPRSTNSTAPAHAEPALPTGPSSGESGSDRGLG
jgi:GH15 family glucan-1,4-alpha-glucosidase